MQERHSNRIRYFTEQGVTTEKFVIPYLEDCMAIDASTRVLEIGCGDGGNMVPFLKRGCPTVGIDLNSKSIANAKAFMAEIMPDAPIELILQDIYEVDAEKLGTFDLIIMRDVIEHIHNQEKFMGFIKRFLKPEGKVFFGFPPWRMPFGGHQQICENKLLSALPFYHLLGKGTYKWVLKTLGESENTIEELLEIKDTGISINRFERIVAHENYTFIKKTLYFINPNYETKFGLQPRVLTPAIASLPHLRDSFTTCYYCVISI